MSQKSAEKVGKGTSSQESGHGSAHITDRTEKTFSVVGSTGHLREQLKALGGKYSAKHKGYDFSHKKREAVEKLLSEHQGGKRAGSVSTQTPSKKSRKTPSQRTPAQVSQEEHGQIQQQAQEQGQMGQEDVAHQEGAAQEGVSEQEAAGQPSASEAEKAGPHVTLSQKPTLDKPYLVHYSPRNYAVIGEAEQYRADLEKSGCKHQAGIKIGTDKYAGWTFHQSKVDTVRGIITDITELAVHLEGGGGGGGQGTMEGAKAGAAGGSSSSSGAAGKRKAAAVAAGSASEGGAEEATAMEA